MNEKLIETREEQSIEGKKVYTPPTLTVYGKLTELTAGGTPNQPEPSSGPGENDPNRRN